MNLVPAKCPNCGANVKIDPATDAAICEHCGSAFITEKAINNYNTTIINNNEYKADTIIIGGDYDSLMKNALDSWEISDYEDAYYKSSKALEIKPDDEYAMLFKAACLLIYKHNYEAPSKVFTNLLLNKKSSLDYDTQTKLLNYLNTACAAEDKRVTAEMNYQENTTNFAPLERIMRIEVLIMKCGEKIYSFSNKEVYKLSLIIYYRNVIHMYDRLLANKEYGGHDTIGRERQVIIERLKQIDPTYKEERKHDFIIGIIGAIVIFFIIIVIVRSCFAG